MPIDAYCLYRGAMGSSAHILKFSLQLALFLLCMAMRIILSTFWFANFVFRVPKCEAVNFDRYHSACTNSTSISNSNAYVCYRHYTISIGKCPMSHYNCHKSIALAWLDPKLYWKNRMVKRAAESNKRSADDNVNVNVTQQGQGGDSTSNPERGSTQTTRASSNKKQKRAPPVTDDSLCP